MHRGPVAGRSFPSPAALASPPPRARAREMRRRPAADADSLPPPRYPSAPPRPFLLRPSTEAPQGGGGARVADGVGAWENQGGFSGDRAHQERRLGRGRRRGSQERG